MPNPVDAWAEERRARNHAKKARKMANRAARGLSRAGKPWHPLNCQCHDCLWGRPVYAPRVMVAHESEA